MTEVVEAVVAAVVAMAVAVFVGVNIGSDGGSRQLSWYSPVDRDLNYQHRYISN